MQDGSSDLKQIHHATMASHRDYDEYGQGVVTMLAKRNDLDIEGAGE
ncbi:hypothetical protein L195_g026202 [Trifolium pratense]|uniref:Uncharacterized protein n=1 Tax=Trifolium pratense TaxID=57577 RepID=A0A2K3NIM4_TRIPR|nr:hypothetical protein L195_g026202 [Trifolium pratense]